MSNICLSPLIDTLASLRKEVFILVWRLNNCRGIQQKAGWLFLFKSCRLGNTSCKYSGCRRKYRRNLIVLDLCRIIS